MRSVAHTGTVSCGPQDLHLVGTVLFICALHCPGWAKEDLEKKIPTILENQLSFLSSTAAKAEMPMAVGTVVAVVVMTVATVAAADTACVSVWRY